MTRIHAADGQLVAEHARERRLYLPIQAVPDLIKAAFLSAEDKNFYEHGGVDFYGIVRALMRQRRRPRLAASAWSAPRPSPSRSRRTSCSPTSRAYDRKIKEALLALRIEQAYSKDKILELYLNEIYLGLGSYGIAAAALELFRQAGQPADDRRGRLSRGAARRRRKTTIRSATRSARIERRNWVIDRMVENGYIRAEDGDDGQGEPARRHDPRRAATTSSPPSIFAEEVRRNLDRACSATKSSTRAASRSARRSIRSCR